MADLLKAPTLPLSHHEMELQDIPLDAFSTDYNHDPFPPNQPPFSSSQPLLHYPALPYPICLQPVFAPENTFLSEHRGQKQRTQEPQEIYHRIDTRATYSFPQIRSAAPYPNIANLALLPSLESTNNSNRFGDPQNLSHAQDQLLSISQLDSISTMEKHISLLEPLKLEQRNGSQKRHRNWQYQTLSVEHSESLQKQEMGMEYRGKRGNGDKERAREDAAMGVGCIAAVFVCGCVVM